MLDLFVKNIEDAVAAAAREVMVGRAGIDVEKDQVLKILRSLKSIILRTVRGYLAAQR